MPTDKQKAASRANGARSRGPKTPEGKARSARNSLNHGLLARAILLEGESRDRFDDLIRTLNETLRPANAFEHLLIGKMAAAHWRQIRIWTLQNGATPSLAEHEMRLDRQFFRAVDRFVRLRTFFAETNPVSPAGAAASPAGPSRFEPRQNPFALGEIPAAPGESKSAPEPQQSKL